MRYETLNGWVIFRSDISDTNLIYYRPDYEHLDQKQEKYQPSTRELAETYPEAEPYLKLKAKNLETRIKELSNPHLIYEIKESSAGAGYDYQKEQEVNEARITHLQNQIELTKNALRQTKNLLYLIGHKGLLAGDTALQISRAKAFAITDLLAFNRMGFAPCPFHNEKNASLKYYPKENRFFCYGCQVGGDSIDFVMRLKGLKFLDAVAYLNG